MTDLILSTDNEAFEYAIAKEVSSALSRVNNRRYAVMPHGEGYAVFLDTSIGYKLDEPNDNSHEQPALKDNQHNDDHEYYEYIYLRPAWRSQLSRLFFLMISFFITLTAHNILITGTRSGYSSEFGVSPLLDVVIKYAVIVMIVYSVYLALRILYNIFSLKYMIGPKGVQVTDGIIEIDETRFEYSQIRGIDRSQSFFQRILGYGQVKISTSNDNDIIFNNIKNPSYYRDIIRERLSAR